MDTRSRQHLCAFPASGRPESRTRSLLLVARGGLTMQTLHRRQDNHGNLVHGPLLVAPSHVLLGACARGMAHATLSLRGLAGCAPKGPGKLPGVPSSSKVACVLRRRPPTQRRPQPGMPNGPGRFLLRLAGHREQILSDVARDESGYPSTESSRIRSCAVERLALRIEEGQSAQSAPGMVEHWAPHPMVTSRLALRARSNVSLVTTDRPRPPS